MVWYEIAGYILGGSGTIGGLYSVYTMGVKKETLAIENLKQVIEQVKAHHNESVIENEKKFNKLERKIEQLKTQDTIKTHAINQGYRCPFPKDEDVCPVTTILENSCEFLAKKV